MTRSKTHAPRIGLALAGGGPLGAIYEIGALCALQESLKGIHFNRLQHYVGVSAGSFIAAALANGITPRHMFSLFIEDHQHPAEAFDPAWLLRPAWDEFLARSLRLPELLLAITWQGTGGGKSFMQTLEQLSPVLPTGVFSNHQIHIELARLFSRHGRTNDFRKLKRRLSLVATQLDSCQPVAFGRPGWDHVPISRAAQASSALPGLFPPVEIDGRHFVDGALVKTMHASIALDEGVDLMLCLNPLVPFDASVRQATHDTAPNWAAPEAIPPIAEGGLPAMLSQAFRSLIHSRLMLGLKGYEQTYPNTDIVLIEPDHRDPELYLANTFSYSQRRHLAEHAYQQTRRLLRSRRIGHGLTKLHRTLNQLEQLLHLPSPTQGRPAW